MITNKISRAFIAIIDAVETYPFYVSGELPIKKIDGVIEKFLTRYPDLLRGRKYAWRIRKKGIPSHKLIVYKPSGKKDIEAFFVLMCSERYDPQESFLDSKNRKTRLVVYGYELYRRTRKGKESPVWSFRIYKDTFKKMYKNMIDAIDNKKDKWLLDWIQSTKKWPGFAGVRKQHYALQRACFGRWLRVRKNIPPEFPRLPYVTRRNAKKHNEEDK